MKKITAPRGTFDVLPADSLRWQDLEATIDGICARFRYGEIRTPIFESTDVFVSTLGDTTDVVVKEMYTFSDRSGRSLTLRPEFTAPVVRAVLEHGMLASPPTKLYYRGPFFRYERPQKGRFRQAHQFGVECLGVAGPEADVEVIALALQVILAAGIDDWTLEINSMGCAGCREHFRSALVEHLAGHESELSQASRERLTRNPLRVLDSKDPSDRAIVASGPTINAFLCPECRAHFDAALALLDAMDIKWQLNPFIVRGFDYYTRTVFEFSSGALGAQNAVCGGGRYDGLVESLGGPPTAAVGFGMGMDRLLIVSKSSAMQRTESNRILEAAFIALDEPSVRALVPVMNAMRRRGISADMDYTRRKVDKQLRAAGDAGAAMAVIVGEEERAAGVATVQDLATRERTRVPLPELEAALASRLGKLTK